MSFSPALDLGLIRTLASVMHESGLTEIAIRKGDLDIRIVGSIAMRSALRLVGAAVEPDHLPVAAPAPVVPPALTSPMVGTAYLSPRDGTTPFPRIGDYVVPGDVVLVIEAMKTSNEIKAHRAGTVSTILVHDGQPVEFGQPLFVID